MLSCCFSCDMQCCLQSQWRRAAGFQPCLSRCKDYCVLFGELSASHAVPAHVKTSARVDHNSFRQHQLFLSNPLTSLSVIFTFIPMIEYHWQPNAHTHTHSTKRISKKHVHPGHAECPFCHCLYCCGIQSSFYFCNSIPGNQGDTVDVNFYCDANCGESDISFWYRIIMFTPQSKC